MAWRPRAEVAKRFFRNLLSKQRFEGFGEPDFPQLFCSARAVRSVAKLPYPA